MNSCEKIDEMEKIVDFLIGKGIDPNVYDLNNKMPSDYTRNPLLKLAFQTGSSFYDDFKGIFKRKELTDFQISKYLVHRFLIEYRTGKKAEIADHILKKYSRENIKKFLLWVYNGIMKKEDQILLKPIFDEFGIDQQNKRSFKEDIKQLYYDQDGKDFVIEVCEKEVRVHKFILEARSQLFREMFILVQDDSNRSKDFTEKSFNAINLLIKFLYFDEITSNDFLISKNRKANQKFLEEFDLNFFQDFFQLNKNSKLLFYKAKFHQ
ncbi:hypothetical protein M0811_10423 [Anaeramoeba ignava]|uniref:BTB domain-containing protein n=1 Tax=Anaeramoeba ignava TaxID=1746090 RepID=A0A9Q0LDU5_ANAIG|nr:hypothetical protein M0811_10423 [Anaeramoeba ignava]